MVVGATIISDLAYMHMCSVINYLFVMIRCMVSGLGEGWGGRGRVVIMLGKPFFQGDKFCFYVASRLINFNLSVVND